MLSERLDKLESFLNDESNFIVKLRMLDGLDQKNADLFLKTLDEISDEIKNELMIEKRLAFLLINVEPLLMSLSRSYSGEERQNIDQLLADINQKMTAIFE